MSFDATKLIKHRIGMAKIVRQSIVVKEIDKLNCGWLVMNCHNRKLNWFDLTTKEHCFTE